MLTNYHTHSTFCDGADTPEEMVLAAVEKGFDALGFSGHGYTKRDSSFCMRDTAGYISEIRRLQSKFSDKLQVYLGVEEDLIHPAERKDFDYIIGSSHYICKDGNFYSIDGSPASFQECIDLFGGDPIAMTEAYYDTFCTYINQRKPDIIGHFDLVTKFDEMNGFRLMQDKTYTTQAEKYLKYALCSGSIFEVNTGAIARGMRTMPYPSEQLLYTIKKEGGKVILSSDCHDRNKLDCYFTETRQYLRDIGFTSCIVLYNGAFVSETL